MDHHGPPCLEGLPPSHPLGGVHPRRRDAGDAVLSVAQYHFVPQVLGW